MPYIGVEIGGTKLQIGIGSGDGTLDALWRGVALPQKGAQGIRNQIVQGWEQLRQQIGAEANNVRAVGIGFGGPVDIAAQRVIRSHQVSGWDDFELGRWAQDVFGVPARVVNDADAGGLAEARFGAGRGVSPVFYLTVASGIGGALIVDGKIYQGVGLGAAEIGHLRIAGLDRGRWIKQTLEKWASGWAIQDFARESLRGQTNPPAFWKSCLTEQPDVELITTKVVAQAAQAGDPLARQAISRAVDALAEGVAQVIALLCPRRLIVGGGVSLMGEDLFFSPLRQRVADIVFAPFANQTQIVPAALGEEVVVHGALAVARDAMAR